MRKPLQRYWKAAWIWTCDPQDTPNSFHLFRRAFTLPGKPRSAMLHWTAGHFAHVYLNGQLIGRGPDRCYFRAKIYHTRDVTALLRRGANVLGMEVHYLGQALWMERHAEGPAGCLMELEIDGKPFIYTDSRWKTAPNRAYANQTEPISIHREWREEFCAAKAVPNWSARNFDDSTWSAAHVVAPAESGPWKRLVAKETPELTADELAPLNVYYSTPGGQGTWECDINCIYNMIGERTEQNPKDDCAVWNDRQDRQELLFDMGRVVAGYPRLEIADATGGTIEVYYGESLNMTLWDTIHLGHGALTWSPFTSRGGRYFRLVITGARNPMTIRRIRWIRTNYPVAHRGAFTSSDPKLDAIWKMCALTAETCAMEHFTDCVGREQVLWMMDFRFQALQHYYYFGDSALARKCFRQFASLQLQNGHILCYGPSCRPIEKLFDKEISKYQVHDWLSFNFYFVLAAWEHFQYTQDREFLEEIYPTCKRSIGYYARSEAKGFATTGEVPGDDHIDWGYEGYSKERAVYSFTQGVYHGALKSLSAMAAALNRHIEARSIARKAADLEARFVRVFVDRQTCLVADCLVKGRRITSGCLHPHIAALRFFDNLPRGVCSRSLELILKRQLKLPRSGIGIALAIEALFRHGKGEAAVALIRDYYGPMLDADLRQVPEFFDMCGVPGADCRWDPAFSRCHSYASLAGMLLQRCVLGAHVEGKTVHVSPSFAGLNHASGLVPTIAGEVEIAWTHRADAVDLTVHAPPAVEVRFEPIDPHEKVRFMLKRQPVSP